ncbi:MAG: PAS domain S-box protein [Opitutales bacterium]|nr:PAS domain S-box protein [Opitutales bacterium]
MAVLVIIGLSLLCLRLAFALRKIRTAIGNLEEAARARRPLLVEKPIRHAGVALDPLQFALNELIEENQKRSLDERGHLEQIRATLGNIREAVFLLDENNFIRLCNDAFAQFLGVPGQMQGRRLETLITGNDFLRQVRLVKEKGHAEPKQMQVNIGGTQKWLEVSGTNLPEQDPDEDRLALFVLHDITHLKNLERMRTDFVANVSHELRTPVTIIKGYVDVLIDDRGQLDAEDEERFLNKIQRNVTRLHQLLEELLMLSRLESAQETIHKDPASLSVLMRETAENFRSNLPPDKEIIYAFAPEPDTLPFDSLRLTQVLENLLDNVKRHAKGFTRITLRTEHRPQGWTCWVEDDGAGIPQKELPFIFERFYRVDKGRSRESGGTGLGLSIVKHIIQLHGGHMLAESTPPKGTRIGFTLPA